MSCSRFTGWGLAALVVFSPSVQARGDAVLSAAIGAGAGAAIGHAIGGRNGAVVGGVLGAATGVAIAQQPVAGAYGVQGEGHPGLGAVAHGYPVGRHPVYAATVVPQYVPTPRGWVYAPVPLRVAPSAAFAYTPPAVVLHPPAAVHHAPAVAIAPLRWRPPVIVYHDPWRGPSRWHAHGGR
jgi:hypothetical protein